MPQLQKAYIEVENGQRIDCMFNPAKFSFSQSNRWESDQIPGKAVPTMRFAGGEGGSFALSLVFDTTSDGKAVTTVHEQAAQTDGRRHDASPATTPSGATAARRG